MKRLIMSLIIGLMLVSPIMASQRLSYDFLLEFYQSHQNKQVGNINTQELQPIIKLSSYSETTYRRPRVCDRSDGECRCNRYCYYRCTSQEEWNLFGTYIRWDCKDSFRGLYQERAGYGGQEDLLNMGYRS